MKRWWWYSSDLAHLINKKLFFIILSFLQDNLQIWTISKTKSLCFKKHDDDGLTNKIIFGGRSRMYQLCILNYLRSRLFFINTELLINKSREKVKKNKNKKKYLNYHKFILYFCFCFFFKKGDTRHHLNKEMNLRVYFVSIYVLLDIFIEI